MRRTVFAWIGATVIVVATALEGRGLADGRYDPGATETEIRIGNIAPYTGFNADYGQEGRAAAAYFRMVNDRGGINGRKVTFISVDDASEPLRSIDLARRLVEDDQVLLLFGVMGTTANLAIRPYLNEKQVPQLFGASDSAVLNDPAHFPWTMGFFAPHRAEGRAYAKHILSVRPEARIAVLHADSDDGREYAAGLAEGLGERAGAMIVKEIAFPRADPQIAGHVDTLKASGADVFVNFATGRLATQAIARAYDLDWHPLQFIPNASLSIAAFLDPAGLEKARGIISNARSKGVQHSGTARDPAVVDYLAWMSRYNTGASIRDQLNVAAYERAEALVALLRQCGDDLTRANVMRQAARLDLRIGMLAQGIRVTTGPRDYQPIKQLYLVRFDGRNWHGFGELVDP